MKKRPEEGDIYREISLISLYISPSSGLFFISPDEDLLFEVETSRVNFLVFNSDDQRNTDVATTADVTTYSHKFGQNFGN